MRKIICILLALGLVACLLAGCGSKQQTTAKETEGTAAEPQGALEDSTFQDPTGGSSPAGSQGTATPTQGSSNAPTTGGTDSPTTGGNDSPTTGGNDSPVTGNPDSNTVSLDYETFKAMTATQKKAYQESFESMDAFFAWYNAAYEAYREDNAPTEIDGSGVITLP